MSNFSFSRNVFERLVVQTHKNQGLFGKGLRMFRPQSDKSSEYKINAASNWLNLAKSYHMQFSQSEVAVLSNLDSYVTTSQRVCSSEWINEAYPSV